MSATELLEQVLRLPDAERAEIVSEVLRSLEPDDDVLDPEEWDRVWMAEIERRQKQIQSGEAVLLDGVEVMEGLRRIVEQPKTT
jgi:hypothetical protein